MFGVCVSYIYTHTVHGFPIGVEKSTNKISGVIYMTKCKKELICTETRKWDPRIANYINNYYVYNVDVHVQYTQHLASKLYLLQKLKRH